MATTVCELQWITYLLKDLNANVPLPIVLWCDNLAALHITSNPVFHECTKRLDIDCHIVRNQFLSGLVLPQKISTVDQIADLFTKPLPVLPFARLASKLGMRDVFHSHLEGGVKVYVMVSFLLITQRCLIPAWMVWSSVRVLVHNQFGEDFIFGVLSEHVPLTC
ncbi:hypothetical protein LIER_19905 [Lithospermum erythrorhizon]|uniref:Uncharacterized protein n=1 Tax=Lithospermum erythrorhizon TaxID=34254 RepID=A0AAV3QJI1_LITER